MSGNMILIFAGVVIFLVGFAIMVCTFMLLIFIPILLNNTPNWGESRKSNWSGVVITALGFLTALVGLPNALVGLFKG